MLNHIKVQLSRDINLLAGVNEFNFKILPPSTVHKVRGVHLKSDGQICIAEFHNGVQIFCR